MTRQGPMLPIEAEGGQRPKSLTPAPVGGARPRTNTILEACNPRRNAPIGSSFRSDRLFPQGGDAPNFRFRVWAGPTRIDCPPANNDPVRSVPDTSGFLIKSFDLRPCRSGETVGSGSW